MQWNSTYQESIFSFANNINTHEGGSHLSGFRSALTRTINKYARDRGELKEKDENLSGEDIREGLTAVISAKLADPQFEGQTKTKLGNPGMAGFVESVVNTKLAEFLEENPGGEPRGHPQGVQASQARAAAPQGARPDAAQVRAGELTAAGQARRLLGQGPVAGRDLHRRGRLRGRLGQAGPRPPHPGRPAAARKILNVERARIDKVLRNEEVPGADHRDRHRGARRVQHRERPLPQGDPDDGRRRGRGAHPHARADAAVPRDAGADRGGLRLHRQAAALQAQAGLARALHREGTPSSRRSCSRTSGRSSRSPTATAPSSS